MADGGGSSAGAAASSGAAAVSSGESSGETAVATKTGDNAEANTGEAKESTPISEKVGEVIDDKAVTVKEVNEKTTINKPHVEGEVTEEKPVEEEKEEKKEKKKEEIKKHKYADRLAKAFPDRTYETDDDYENAHEEYVKDIEGYRERGIVANQKLVALFEAEPEIADVVSEMIKGATFRSALARHIGAGDLVPELGDPDYSAYEENTKQRLERIAKADAFNKEFNENLEFSQKSVESFAEENNLKAEEAKKVLEEFDDMLKDIYRGKITKETLAKIVRAIKHDEAVKEAKEEAKIEGRNEAIKEKIGKEKETAKDDGMPTLTKTGDAIEDNTELPDEVKIIDRILSGAKKRTNF